MNWRHAIAAFGLAAGMISESAYAIPVTITVGYGGIFETFSADSDNSGYIGSDLGGGFTSIFALGFPDYSANGFIPGGETQTAPGFYKTSEQIEVDFYFDGKPADLNNFSISNGIIPNPSGTNRAVYFGYTVNSDGTIDEVGPTPLVDDFTLTSFSVSTRSLGTVPLPASAPMFGAGLVAIGAASYAAKRKRAAAA